MVRQDEVIALILAIGVFIFMAGNSKILRQFPSSRLLMTGFCLYLAASIFTIVEGFAFETVLNVLEHTCYFSSALCAAIWVSITVASERRGN